MTIIEPGFVETELQGHNENPIVVEQIEKMQEQIGDLLQADDIADGIALGGHAAAARVGQRGVDPTHAAAALSLPA